MDIPNHIEEKVEDYLRKNEPGFRKIRNIIIESEDNDSITYRVRYKEVVMGMSAEDTTYITLPK